MPEATFWVEQASSEHAASIAEAASSAAGFIVLAAEIRWAGGEPRVSRPEIAWDALRQARRPISLAIRMAAPGPTDEQADASSRGLHALAQAVLAEAKTQDCPASGLVLDLSNSTSPPAVFTGWLQALGEAAGPVPLLPIIPPYWLEQRSGRALLQERGGFVLRGGPPQLPARLTAQTLPARCAPEDVLQWSEAAARLGVPFRVLLPAFSEFVGVRQDGRVVGRSPTRRDPLWPTDLAILPWTAEPDALASLVASWTRDRPAQLAGIIWDRLPAASDRSTLPWRTLQAVLQGRAPGGDLRVEVSTESPHKITLFNRGERAEPLPERVDVEWAHAEVYEGDGLAPYVLEPPPPGEVIAHFHRQPGREASPIAPGEHRGVGWLQLDRPRQPRARIISQ